MSNRWTEPKIPCNKCGKLCSEAVFNHVKNLPPMMGFYPLPEVMDCAICKQAVCKECSYGFGMFIFTCKEKCKEKMENRLS